MDDHDGGVRALHDDLARRRGPALVAHAATARTSRWCTAAPVTEDVAEAAWEELRGHVADVRRAHHAVHVVESRPGGWVAIDGFDLVPVLAAD